VKKILQLKGVDEKKKRDVLIYLDLCGSLIGNKKVYYQLTF